MALEPLSLLGAVRSVSLNMVQPLRPLGVLHHLGGMVRSFLVLLSSVVVAYTDWLSQRCFHVSQYTHRRVTGTYGSLITATQNTLPQEGIRVCTSGHLDRGEKQYSISFTVSAPK
jgi:hypothetical protein